MAHADRARARGGRARRRGRACASGAASCGRCARSASSTTCCSTCASTGPRSAWSCCRPRATPARVLAADAALAANREDWFVSEVLHHMKRVLKRLDLTARSLLRRRSTRARASRARSSSWPSPPTAPTCSTPTAGPTIALSDAERRARCRCANGLTRLETRFLGEPATADAAARRAPATPRRRSRRASSPSRPTTSTGRTRCASPSRSAPASRPTRSRAWRRTCASPGPETMETKIFGRLSAWQNWIFQRPNAVGEQGALTLYGKPERAPLRLDADVGEHRCRTST